MECNFTKQGDTLRRNISLTYKQTGSVVDLTGCVAYSQIRVKPGEEEYIDGSCSINTETGVITVTYSAEQMSDLLPGDYGFDVRLELDGDRRTIYTERFTVIKPYTDRGEATGVENVEQEEQEGGE